MIISIGSGDTPDGSVAGGGGLSLGAIFGVICGGMAGLLLLTLSLGFIGDKIRLVKSRKATRTERDRREMDIVQLAANQQAAVVVEMGRLDRELPILEEDEFEDLDDMAKISHATDEEQGGAWLEGHHAGADLGLPEYHV